MGNEDLHESPGKNKGKLWKSNVNFLTRIRSIYFFFHFEWKCDSSLCFRLLLDSRILHENIYANK